MPMVGTVGYREQHEMSVANTQTLAMAPRAAKRKVVVLVHGLGAHRLMMWLLGQRLSRRGYRVVNWGYRSIRRTIEAHGCDLQRDLRKLEQDATVDEFYLVTHSMGGIVGRTALALAAREGRSFQNLHRMVMLAPPNRGSKVANLFGPWLKPICGTIDQLASRPDSYVNCLPLPQQLEVGIIAAQYDGLVHLESTYLGVERDHLVWPYTLHSGVLFRFGVAEQIAHFLEQGSFVRPEKSVALSA
jgi:pimeloyl-ACP methyl ester carboxylesterase